jgi:hypothetical protein
VLLILLQTIPHGLLDINRLHSMPSKQQIVATCCDEPQIYLLDLQRQADLQQQQQQQQGSVRSGSSGGSAKAAKAAGAENSESDTEYDDATSSQQSGVSANGSCSSEPDVKAVAAVLGGRDAGGFALEWNPVLPGLLLAADVRGGVQLYDVQRGGSSSSSSSGVWGSSSSDRLQIQPVQVSGVGV